jgi:hypothetical protein
VEGIARLLERCRHWLYRYLLCLISPVRTAPYKTVAFLKRRERQEWVTANHPGRQIPIFAFLLLETYLMGRRVGSACERRMQKMSTGLLSSDKSPQCFKGPEPIPFNFGCFVRNGE